MEELFSFWVTFSKDDEKYLQNVINTLGKKYDAPTFRPHLTIYGSVQTTLVKARAGAERVITGMRPFDVHLEKLDLTDDFFKTVFLSIHDHPLLSHLNWDLRETLDPLGTYIFKPHVSLIYTKLPEKTKKEIIAGLNLKESFRVEKITVSSPGENNKNWFSINEWQKAYEKNLDGS